MASHERNLLYVTLKLDHFLSLFHINFLQENIPVYQNFQYFSSYAIQYFRNDTTWWAQIQGKARKFKEVKSFENDGTTL